MIGRVGVIIRHLVPLAWALLVIVVVAAAAAGTAWLVRRDVAGDPIEVVAPPSIPTGPATLPAGRDYYLWVKLIEVAPQKSNGDAWDADGSGPDLRFVLWWNGNQVFSSPKRPESLIAKWDLVGADVLELLKSGKLDVESAIQAPIVRVDPGMTIAIEIEDADYTRDDLVARFEFPLDTLLPGENEIPPPDGSPLKRLVVQAIDARTPVADLIDLVSRR
jgi:hypothetical protein